MDLVSGAASVAQLSAYSGSAVQYLNRLYKATQDGPSSIQDHGRNVSALITILSRLWEHDSLDLDLLVPLLIEITVVARHLSSSLTHLGPLRLSWILLTKGREIDDAFRAIHDKSELIQIHLSERSHAVLTRIHSGLFNPDRIGSPTPQSTPKKVRVVILPSKTEVDAY